MCHVAGIESRLPSAGPALRFAPLLLVPAFLIASTFPGRFHVSPGYWVLSCAAAVCFAAGRRRPVFASCALSALAVPLFATEAWGLSGLVPYLGAVALADVTARTDRDAVIAALAVLWSAAVLLGNWLDVHQSFWSAANLVTLVAVAGVPVLLGLYLRGQRRLALAAASTIRSQERTAMARELHDLVAHHMASIVLRVSVAEHVLADPDPRVEEVLDDVHRTASDALSDIRRLQHALRDPTFGEIAAIEPDAIWSEIDAAVARTRAAGFVIDSHIDRGTIELDALSRLTLLRVTQESLTNVMKHATPTTPVGLTIEPGDDGIAVHVTSAVSGSAETDRNGHGLIGMGERLSLIGGSLAARRVGQSWVIDAWLPVR